MYLAVPTEKSCARAWAAAATAIMQAREAYNVVVDVEDAVSHDDVDQSVISAVDEFLKEKCQNPVATVANTIFPQALYDQYGSPEFYEEYLKVFEALTKSKRWGRYFERMIRYPIPGGGIINPLALLIEKINKQEAGRQTYRFAYELAIYDPVRDGRMLRGAQCLSHISIKLHPLRGLTLTAMYRNHTYIRRALGNLIGLGRLQAFIAKETGYPVGPLTCLSTHAELDTGDSWGIVEARTLVERAETLIRGKHESARYATC